MFAIIEIIEAEVFQRQKYNYNYLACKELFLFLQWRDSKLLVSGTLFIKNTLLHSYNFLNFLYNKMYPLLTDIEIRDILLSLRVCFKPTMLWNLGFTACNSPECMQMTCASKSLWKTNPVSPGCWRPCEQYIQTWPGHCCSPNTA